jgi:hypothetical protein
MKKFISALLTAIMVLSLGITASASTFTTQDALTILRYAAGLEELTAEQRELYDLNNDGKVDSADALAVLRIAAGLPAFPPPPMGNTSGNIWIEKDHSASFSYSPSPAFNVSGNYVYFSGANGHLGQGRYSFFKQRIDGTGSRTELLPREGVSYINVVGNMLYFVLDSDGGIYKMDTNGNNKTLLTNLEWGPGSRKYAHMTVVGDWIYYSNTEAVFRMDTNGQNKTQIVTRSIPDDSYRSAYGIGSFGDLTLIGMDGAWVYYRALASCGWTAETTEGIWKIRPDGSEKTRLTEHVSRYNVLDGGFIYHYDRTSLPTALLRTSVTTGQTTTVKAIDNHFHERPFNVSGGFIFYVGGENEWGNFSGNQGLYRMNAADGSGRTRLATTASPSFGGYNMFIFGGWVYYQESREGTGGLGWTSRIRFDGSDNQRTGFTLS